MINKILAVIALLATLVIFMNSVVEAEERIAVLISSQELPFEETLTGFKGYLRKQGVQTDYEVYRLEGDDSKAGQVVQKVKKSGVNLIFTLGSLAADTAIREIADIPIVACLILRPDNLKRASNATGVGLEFPLEIQFKWLHRFLPQARTIGVIYNPKENQKRIEAATNIVKNMGLRLEAQEVSAPQDVPAALDNLSRSADVLWGVTDNIVMTPQIAKHVLLFSFRNSIPFIGLSPMWVKAGAVYSLDWDYADLGSQCGEMAQKILKGVLPSAIPPASPRKAMYSLNLNTARQMKITISEELIQGARHTF